MTPIGKIGGFRFLDPRKEAEVLALRRDFSKLDLHQLGHLVEEQRIFDTTHERPYEWSGQMQILPVGGGLGRYFRSESYLRAVESEAKRLTFSIVAEAGVGAIAMNHCISMKNTENWEVSLTLFNSPPILGGGRGR